MSNINGLLRCAKIYLTALQPLMYDSLAVEWYYHKS